MPHLYNVGIKAVIVNKKLQKVLFLKNHDNHGTLIYSFPGGRMEQGETVETALKRELSEEIKNLKDFQIGDVLSANPRAFDLEGGIGLFLVTVHVDTDIEVPELSDEHSGYEWFSFEELNKALPIEKNGAVIDNESFRVSAIKVLRKFRN